MTILIALGVPAILWIAAMLFLPKGSFLMDQHGHKGSFFPLLILYSVWAYVLFAADAWFGSATKSGDLGTIFLVSGLCAVFFSGVLLYFYESYLHCRALTKPPQISDDEWSKLSPDMQRVSAVSATSNYTRVKYALVLALGFSAFLLFVAGVIGMILGAKK